MYPFGFADLSCLRPWQVITDIEKKQNDRLRKRKKNLKKMLVRRVLLKQQQCARTALLTGSVALLYRCCVTRLVGRNANTLSNTPRWAYWSEWTLQKLRRSCC